MTDDEIKALVKTTAGNYPNIQARDLTHTTKLWKDIFGRLPYDLFKAALYRTYDTAKFWPSVADIKEQVENVREERERRAFELKTNSCPNCAGLGIILIQQGGEERAAKCLCAAGETYYNGLPPAPSWAIVSDRRLVTTGTEAEGEIPF